MPTEAAQSQQNVKLFNRKLVVSMRMVLVGIVILAIVLRVLSALYLGNKVVDFPGIFDQISYDGLARRVVDGLGFTFGEDHWPLTRAGEPTAHWSYLYTYYLAMVYNLFGTQPIIARMLQAVLVGVLHTYIIFRIGEKTFSKTVGLIAAAITAVYIYFFYYAGALMTEPFYITAILFSLFIGMELAENGDRKHDLTLGIALGLAIAITVLLRQLFLLFIPFLLGWIWFARFRRGLCMPLVSTIIALSLVFLCILPFSLYNQARFGRFVLLNTNSGFAFYWGNHPIYGTHFLPLLPPEMGTYQDLVPGEIRHLDEAALDQELLRRGIQFIVADPERYMLLSLSRISVYFMFWPSSSSGLVSNISRVFSFGLTLPFMLYGLFMSIVRKRTDNGNRFLDLLGSPEGLLIIFALIYTFIHLLSWTLIRYRLPVDAVLIPFAAFAIQDLYRRFVLLIHKE